MGLKKTPRCSNAPSTNQAIRAIIGNLLKPRVKSGVELDDSARAKKVRLTPRLIIY